MIGIQEHANALGFRGIYLLKPAPYPYFQARRKQGTLHENSNHVSDDPMRDYPWMNAVLLLLYPYRPYPENVPVSGYYPASNRSYHAAASLLQYLKERDIRAERVSIPIRETMLRHGIGIACKNGLTAVEPFGTRFVAQALVLKATDELLQYRTETIVAEYKTCSKTCMLCAAACPSRAISALGFSYPECIRADMDGKDMEPKTMDRLDCLFGCEHCQFVCPMNAGVAIETDVPAAFSLDKILEGKVGAVYDLIGKNMRTGGRVEQQALVLAANLGRSDLLPLMQRYLSDPRSAVVRTAEYAISVLHNSLE